MDTILTDLEIRVLGCLIEKHLTTPEYYPLTLNSLTNACNQKSNRFPIVEYDETAVQEGLDHLRQKELALMVTGAGIRTPKYRHCIKEKWRMGDGQMALLSELMLRGPQTPGELRTRGERMHPFDGLEEVEQILSDLNAGEKPWIVKLPRTPGQKESRYAHLLSGQPPSVDDWADRAVLSDRIEPARFELLEEKVQSLQKELDELKKAFSDFIAQFK